MQTRDGEKEGVERCGRAPERPGAREGNRNRALGELETATARTREGERVYCIDRVLDQSLP